MIRRRIFVISKGPRLHIYLHCKSEPSPPLNSLCVEIWLARRNLDPVAFVLYLGQEEASERRLTDLVSSRKKRFSEWNSTLKWVVSLLCPSLCLTLAVKWWNTQTMGVNGGPGIWRRVREACTNRKWPWARSSFSKDGSGTVVFASTDEVLSFVYRPNLTVRVSCIFAS